MNHRTTSVRLPTPEAPGAAVSRRAHSPSATPVRARIAVAGSRADLAAAIATVTGHDAEAMRAATASAELAVREAARNDPARLLDAGLGVVRDAIDLYRDGGRLTLPRQIAWLTVVLANPGVRDDAWARMDPAHRIAHARLWTDATRRASRGYIAAPACLLAFTAWQDGNGALASLALDRAIVDDPDCGMARLLADALDTGLPPAFRLPMKPEKVTTR